MRSYCRECDREWKRKKWQSDPKYRAYAKQWIEENREHYNARARGYYNPEKSRQYYVKNKERYRKWGHAYYQKHKEQHNLQTKQWREENPDVVRSMVRNYRTRKRNATGSHTADDIRRLWWFQMGRCQYCGKKLHHGMRGFHVDHMQPLSRGGSNDPANLALACGRCNDSKHNKTSTEFLALVT